MQDDVRLFESRRPLYEGFTRALDDFLREELRLRGVENVDVDSRTKTVESFREKISRPGKQYTAPLKQITDLSGVRVIVCYASDITTVEEIVDQHFRVHPEMSVDKGAQLAPNMFGYLSVHYVVSIDGHKTRDPRWEEFEGLQAEIQIRTVLQHSWAMVSHALQYKRDSDVPAELSRKLFRLAGLFELADEEFIDIRNAHESLTTEVSRDFARTRNALRVNIISVVAMVNSSVAVESLVSTATELGAFTFFDQRSVPDARDDFSLITQEARRLSIVTIGRLERDVGRAVPRMPAFLAGLAAITDWHITRAFLVFLALMVAYPKRFKAEHLTAKRGWDATIAARVAELVQKGQDEDV